MNALTTGLDGLRWCIGPRGESQRRGYLESVRLSSPHRMETKYGIAFFVVAVVIGLVLTRDTPVLGHERIRLGGVIAFLIFCRI